MVQLLIVPLAEELAVVDGVHLTRNQLLLTRRASETLHVIELQEIHRKERVIMLIHRKERVIMQYTRQRGLSCNTQEREGYLITPHPFNAQEREDYHVIHRRGLSHYTTPINCMISSVK